MKKWSVGSDSAVQRISDVSFRLIRNAVFISSVVLSMLMVQPSHAAEPIQTKRVLVLYSEDKAHPAHELTDQGIREGLSSTQLFNVQIYNEYLDVSRFGAAFHARAMADHLRRKYSEMKIDAIIAVYPYTVDFLLSERRALFPEVPIIACEMIRSNAENLEGTPVRRFLTGTIVGDNIAGLWDAALRLKPATKRVALVAGTAPNDLASEQVFRHGLSAYAERIDLVDLTKLTMDETLSRVGSLPADTLVLYSTMFRDGAGNTFVPREALSLIAKASKVPVFALYESYLGFGIVGGHLVSFEEQGREAAAMALRILGGESPSSIPFGGEKAYVDAYDWRELKRWGIEEASLPPGSTVRFRQLSIWEEYRKTILGAVSLIVVETLLVIGLFVNLCKRRKAEDALAESALRYRTVAEYTYDWEYWSAPDGTLRYVSPSCERTTGYSVREFMDDPSLFLRIIVPEDRGAWEEHDHHAPTELQSQAIEFRIRTKEGEIRWIEHTCQPVNDSQGTFLGIRASNRDISERKKAEGEAQQQRNELAHVSRVATMGELTSSLAHELNQPLAAIRNYANAAKRFLSETEPDVSRARQALDGIIRDDRRASEVISGVRGLLKKKEPSYHLVRINELIREVLALIRSDSHLEGFSIDVELAPDLPSVAGDRVQLQQVLLNLMLNAVDAMDKVKLDLRKLVIKTESGDDGCVKVSVRDSGVGMDEAHREKLFEPFYTTKSEGLGMGLAISARIIHAHEGSIWAENNPDGGATFCFTLPPLSKENSRHSTLDTL
jgi:PAS domain S-box-containing protein